MICRVCKQAGKVLHTEGQEAAAALHERCEYLQCTCHHEVDLDAIDPRWLNRADHP